jgi:DNA-binding response OmpR family regulator
MTPESSCLWVLVADPDLASARHVARVLESLGISCFRTARGKLALGLARARPLFAVVDTALSDVPGVELARRLRAEHGLVVMVTDATDEFEVEVAARQAGITHFAHKPVLREEVEALVKHAMSMRGRDVYREPPARRSA